ncbi:MAG TPA: iron-sulfur cluster repair di-iron protein [Terriglobales bacterium]|nr:iron-sulfur cluster repair di-iron protein [Terriglobales bacterium]
MSQKSVHIMLAENQEAKKILAELGALLGAATQPEPSLPLKRKENMALTATKTVRELAVEVPNATLVFEKLGIDYCCGGDRPLEEACASANVAVDDVLRALEPGIDSSPTIATRDWNTAPLGELVDHIVGKHHSYVKAEVPRLQALIAKVVGAHGKNHPELEQVRVAFSELANELVGHLMKEEQILFPYVKQMAAGASGGPCCFGTVQNPIRVMMLEHDNAGEKLREMRNATNNYTLPTDACLSYSTLFVALVGFEQDLHQHVHLENNILFPRAVRMESER